MGLAINTESRQGSTVVRLDGDFDLYSGAEVRTAVEPLIARNGNAVYLDLARVTFLDSSGLGTLVGLQKVANRAHARFILCAPSPQLQKIMDVTNLRDAFTIVSEVPGVEESSVDDSGPPNG
jgi:anti-anti-sigma factor